MIFQQEKLFLKVLRQVYRKKIDSSDHLSQKSFRVHQNHLKTKKSSRRLTKILRIRQKRQGGFFQKFLTTKGHLGSGQWTKDMTESLGGIRHEMSVFDAHQTKIAWCQVFHFLTQKFSQKKKLKILFVNTSEQYRNLVKKVAYATHQKYMNEKWVGGTLTNWSQISQSYSLFARFHYLFGDFLKKRKIHLPLYEKARRIYSGLLPKNTLSSHLPNSFPYTSSKKSSRFSNDGLPDILFLINPAENMSILHEANLLKIPVIALVDSHTQSSGIDYTIPGNVQSIEFVYWSLNMITIFLQKQKKRHTKILKLLKLLHFK